MAKFRVRLKIQALELEIDGEREDIHAINAAVQNQLSGFVQPAEILANGHKQIEDGGQVLDAEAVKAKGRAITRKKPPTDGAAAQPIEYRHDSSKYGNPQQTWSLIEKCVWLLAVIEGITTTKEVSGPQLAATFKHYYKASGKLYPPTVTRELGKAKVQNPALVGEDKGLWFLTVAGKTEAQRLIDSVLNPPAA